MTHAMTPHQLLDCSIASSGASGLELDEIQGDVLIGMQKNVERFIFFRIEDVATFKTRLRSHLAPQMTTTRTVCSREFQLFEYKNQGKTDLLPMIGVNMGFTNRGIEKLVPGARLGDASFDAGAVARAASLGDPVERSKPTTWLKPFSGSSIDGVFLITGELQSAVDDEADRLTRILNSAIRVIYNESGAVRPELNRGHEHFGWRDGISQPGIAGLTQPYPGQRLLDPGRFVFGYPGEPPSSDPRPAWIRNGSFMVFRRLKQLVPEFEQYLLTQAHSLGVDPVLLGARLVGRWKTGAPLDLTPTQDDVTVGADPQRNNHFDFSDDLAQRRCPFGAHVRKTNPREDLSGRQDTLVDPHRIIRAGIPFGGDVTQPERALHSTQQERGLMFVCYQTSIANQFEFVQTQWANNPAFLSDRRHADGSAVQVGFDPIIGQNADSGQTRARTMDEPLPNYPHGNVRSSLHQPNDFVVPTGGAYFFMPSISAMKKELTTADFDPSAATS